MTNPVEGYKVYEAAAPSAPPPTPNLDPPPPPYPGPGQLDQQQLPVYLSNQIAQGWGPYPPPPPPNLQSLPGYHPNQYGSISPAASTSLSSTITVQPPGFYSSVPTTPTSTNPLRHNVPTSTNRRVFAGNSCPRCRVGALIDDFDCAAIFLAIFFFPLGVLCCIAMGRKRCTNCGFTF